MSIRYCSLIALAVVLVTTLWFAMLGSRSLFDPDEGRYAEIPREMLQSGQWVIPHLNGLVYLEKPPLQYWLTAFGFRYLGETEMVARLCPGLAGFCSLAIVFFLGRRIWGIAAGYKASLLTSGSALFVLLGHQLTLDMLLSLTLLATLSCFLLAQLQRSDSVRCRNWMLGCWVAMALAVLTKGFIGVLAPAVTLLGYVLWQRDRDALRFLYIRWGLPLFVLTTAPWFTLAARGNPDFLRFFIVREHFERFLTPIEHRSEPWWFFIIVLAVGILPWMPEAVSKIFAAGRRSVPRGQFDAARVLWVWCTFLFLFFSFSNSKLVPYVLPVVPALALLCASRPTRSDRLTLIVGAALSIAGCVCVIALANSTWEARKIGAVAAQAQITLTCTATLLAIAAAVSIVLALRKLERIALPVLCMAWLFASFGILFGGIAAQNIFSAKDLASAVRGVATPDAPVFSVQVYDQSLPFYLRHSVILVDYRDEFALGLDQEPTRGIPDLSEFSQRWQKLDNAYAVMRPKTRDALIALGVPMREVAHARNRVVVSRR